MWLFCLFPEEIWQTLSNLSSIMLISSSLSASSLVLIDLSNQKRLWLCCCQQSIQTLFWCVVICQTKEQQILEWNYHKRRHVLKTGTMFFCLWADQCGWSSVLFSSCWIIISYVCSISQELFICACCCGPPFLLWNVLVTLWYAIISHVFERRTNFWFFLSQWQNFCLTVFFCLSSSRFL
jgi:hypothetical protein